VAKVRTLTAEAALQGAQLVVFPEAFVSGYPKGLDFGARVGARTLEGRHMFRRYFESAVEIPSAAATNLGAIARDHSVYLVIGVIERDQGALYCTVQFSSSILEGTAGQASQVDAHSYGKAHFGHGRQLDHAGLRYALGRLGAVICC
jgi:nitrilase